MSELARRLLGKLKSSRGESITEVLVAVLISGLAILMLGTVIASAVNTNKASRDAMGEYYTANNGIATVTGSGSGSIKLKGVGTDGDYILLEGNSTSVGVNYSTSLAHGSITVVSYEPV